MSLWICPECGATWEAVASDGVFDFDRDQAVMRAEWILVESPTLRAG
jgi:acetone carboxylase gamma subunit